MIFTVDLPMLEQLLTLDHATGRLFWRERTREMFPAAIRLKAWNAQFARREALTADNGRGYRQGIILGRTTKAHHVVWALANGEWPQDQIDHINGERSDNRPSNLRVVSNAENQRNRRLQSNNKSGAPGVVWLNRNRKWAAQISISGKRVHLGLFANRAEAELARKAAEKKHGFHVNHGSRA